MGPSRNKCHKKGSSTQGRFLPSPIPKSPKNTHLKRSSLKLFFCKKSALETRSEPLNDKNEGKVRKNDSFFMIFSHFFKVLVVSPVDGHFWGVQSTQGRLSPSPLPNPAKKVLFEKIALETFFLHLSARSWTRIDLRMTQKHKK